MAFVVCEPCRDCKYTDCVTVCPCECFYQDDEMLYIDPSECIDCAASVGEIHPAQRRASGHPESERRSYHGAPRAEVRTGLLFVIFSNRTRMNVQPAEQAVGTSAVRER
jgi:hypothetical protein